METRDWKLSLDSVTETASGPGDVTVDGNCSKLKVFKAETDSDLGHGCECEYASDVPVGGFTSVTLMPFFSGKDFQ